MMFNEALGMARSYYAATSNRAPPAPQLDGDIDVDLVVVGGGCTGLSAAYHAARAGLSVVLLEGGRIGWGASGRNGGQITPGLRMGARELVRSFGEDHARRLFDLAVAARDEVVELIERNGIACDLKLTGHLDAAIRARDYDDLKREAECRIQKMDYRHIALLEASAVRTQVDHPYAGGMLDRNAGHLHPLNYTLGLADVALGAGARLCSLSPATGVEAGGSGVTVATATGRVRAQACILAGDALMGQLGHHIGRYIMPVANYIVATEPLDNPEKFIPQDVTVSDSRFVVNYYRLSADGRMLFGGGERYVTSEPRDIAAFVRPYMDRAFPALRNSRIDYAWGGLVSITRSRLPHIGRQGPIFWAHGYSGKGTILSTLAGRLMADAVRGDAAGLDLFASVAPPAFPGGTILRGPMHTLAMLWYAARDRLGL